MSSIIRFATPRDAQQIAALFHHTVRTINSRDYLPDQINAWAGESPNPEKWLRRLANRKTFVAESAGGVLGFAELHNDGHIDAFYVHAEHQREGIGAALLARIENEAELLGVTTLIAEASITARPFFEKHGFQTAHSQEVQYNGAVFTNYKMTKALRAKLSTVIS